MTKRQITILIFLGIFGVLAFLPALFVDQLTAKATSSPYSELFAYGESLKGDSSYDKKASEVASKISIHHTNDGDYYSIKGENGSCLVYFLVEPKPREEKAIFCN